MSTSRSRDIVRVVILIALYVVVARLGLLFDAVGGFATLVWSPTGIALAAILLFGYRLWPALVLGAFVATVWAGAHPLVALGIALGNTLEAIVGAYALRCIPGFRPSLDRLRDALGLVLFAAGLSTMISATIGVVSLYLGGSLPAPLLDDTWRAWWLGNMIGDLVLAPVLLMFSTPHARVALLQPSKRLVEVLALGAVVLLIGGYVFGAPSGSDAGSLEQVYLVVPLLIWAALRFGQPGVVWSGFAIAAMAIAGTVSDRGPFAQPALSEGLLTLQAFLAIVSATFLTLGASVSERREMLRALRIARDELEDRVADRTAELVRTNTDLQLRETQLSKAEEALRRVNDELEGKVEARAIELLTMNAMLQAVVNESPMALVVIDRDLKVTMWNPAAEHIFGWKAEEVLGRPLPNIPEAQEDHFKQRVARVFRGEAVRCLDVNRLKKDGTIIHAILSSAPLHDAKNQIVGLVDAVADISDRVQLLHKLEDAVRTRDAFLSMASHELRTPLNALHLHVQILLRTGEKGLAREAEPAALVRRAEIIDRQVKRLSKLIDTLLDVSRITAGRLELELEDADLSDVVREVVTRFEDEARRAHCQVSLRAELPVIGHWDRMRLEQVAANLLSNAVKYGAGGAIDVLVEADARSARLIVRDRGIGIAPEDQARIFERFEQLTPGQRVGGFGIGLWLSRKIVEALGGTIAVTSELGKGSTFVVELPTRRGDVGPEDETAERILVVQKPVQIDAILSAVERYRMS